MVITKRDIEILKVCLEQKYLILDQIGKLFFPKSRDLYGVPARRVNMLMKEGYLRAFKPRVGHKTLYMVTLLGVRLLQQKGLDQRLRVLREPDLRTYEHDLTVTDVRVKFAVGFESATYWMPERVLKLGNARKKVPDGVVGNERHSLVIEVELTLKKRAYYERVLTDTYMDHHRDDAILYLVKDEGMRHWLIKNAGHWGRIYFCTLEDFFREGSRAVFCNGHGDELYPEAVLRGADPDAYADRVWTEEREA